MVGINVMISIQLTWSSSLTRSSTTLAWVKISLWIMVRWGISACTSWWSRVCQQTAEWTRINKLKCLRKCYNIYQYIVNKEIYIPHLRRPPIPQYNQEDQGLWRAGTRDWTTTMLSSVPCLPEGLVIIFWKCTRVHRNAELGTSLFVKLCVIVMSIYHGSNTLS